MVDEAYDVLDPGRHAGTARGLPQDHGEPVSPQAAHGRSRRELKKALDSRNVSSSPINAPQCHHELAEWSGRCRGGAGAGIPTSPLPWRDHAKADTDQSSPGPWIPVVPYQGIASPLKPCRVSTALFSLTETASARTHRSGPKVRSVFPGVACMIELEQPSREGLYETNH